MPHDLLLREGRIGAMPMRNRLIAGPMERAMANRDGSLTQEYVDYLVERARGGASLSMVESTYVDTRGMGNLHQVGCHADHVVPALRRAAEGIHAEGGRLGLELYFGGRVTPPWTSQRQPLAPSSVGCAILQPQPSPREMTHADIAAITVRFAEAAARAVSAGVDLIHLHGAHGYLLGAFLSPFSNHRTDVYGGSLRNRARFALEVLAAVRDAVGPDVPIGYRISADEYVPGGLTVTEAAQHAVLLADAGIDLIDVTGGIYETVHMIAQGPSRPRGAFVEQALAIKAAVGDRVPVSVAQRLDRPADAAAALERGLDFVTLSRAFHADPHYVSKLEAGRERDIVPCISCLRCSDLLAAGVPARCAANPATGSERRRSHPRPSHTRRRVLIAGGGPGGLQAAVALARRGQDVTLFEREDALGGQIRYAARITPDYADLVGHLEGQLAQLGVDVRLGCELAPDASDLDRADAVVVATGARGGLRFAPVLDGAPTLDVFEAIDRAGWEPGARVVVAGGDGATCFTALHLAAAGLRVELVEPSSMVAHDKGVAARGELLQWLGETPSVHVRTESTVEEIGPGHVIVQRRGEHERLDGIVCVVLGGRRADNALGEELVRLRPELEVHAIGDAVRPRDMYAAGQEGAEVAEAIARGALV
jgi:2,4-dienoyl-CoA reductase-like NADH-dependent reductase (Old Yellow Enzyme family)/thioredoxin reductase